MLLHICSQNILIVLDMQRIRCSVENDKAVAIENDESKKERVLVSCVQ